MERELVRVEQYWGAVPAFEKAIRGGIATNAVAARIAAGWLGLSGRQLRRLHQRALTTGTLRRSAGGGRPATLSNKKSVAEGLAKAVARRKGKMSMREMATTLKQQNDGAGSTTSVRAILNNFNFKVASQKLVPMLTPQHQQRRLEWALEHLNDVWSSRRVVRVDIDEKYFRIARVGRSQRIYIPPTELLGDDEAEVVAEKPLSSKKQIPGVMFLAGVAPPDPARGFDGKIGIFPCVQEVNQKIRSKFRNAGEIRREPTELNRVGFVAMLKTQLCPAMVAACPWARKFIVQMDNAGGHGSRGSGMATTLGMLNPWGAQQRPPISFLTQPARSPEMNALDLGAWWSLETEVAKVKADPLLNMPTAEIIMRAVKIAWDQNWDATSKLREIFKSKTVVMGEVAKQRGGAISLPHGRKS